jgi:virginiamycin B lyase
MRSSAVVTTACRRTVLAILAAFICSKAGADTPKAPAPPPPEPTSADWLQLLPDGETKRRFILDCTGCHIFDAQFFRAEGRKRTATEWEQVIDRMLGYAGATTSFPVMSSGVDAKAMSAWLVEHLEKEPRAATARQPASEVREFLLPVAQDLAHDVAVDAQGRIVVTGMMTHKMYVLEPAKGTFEPVEIPVPKANPRAVEIDAQGNWWVVLGMRHMLARYTPASQRWTTFDVEVYPHSVALGRDGSVWYNGHFTRAPEIIGRVVPATGKVERVELPPHPTLGQAPGGPIPYEIRVAPDGRVWVSELQGNRLVCWNPRTWRPEIFDMPVTWSGPRRFDIDSTGVLWIPAYAANELVRYDPATRSVRSFRLPIADAVPYVARLDPGTGLVWIGTSAADALFSFDPAKSRFETYHLPSHGALVRHLAIDLRTHQVWIAYGGAPGMPARIARLVPRSGGGASVVRSGRP